MAIASMPAKIIRTLRTIDQVTACFATVTVGVGFIDASFPVSLGSFRVAAQKHFDKYGLVFFLVAETFVRYRVGVPGGGLHKLIRWREAVTAITLGFFVEVAASIRLCY